MKFKKTLAAVVASALAVSSMAVSSFALIESFEEITLDGKEVKGPKMAQYAISAFVSEPNKALSKMTLECVVPTTEDWFGGGGAVGLDTTDGWAQVDFGINTEDPALTPDATTGEITFEVVFDPPVIPTITKEDDDGNIVDGLLQIGWWWGAGDTLTIKSAVAETVDVEEETSSEEEEPSSDEEPASSDEEPASSDEEPASSDEEPASSDEEPASSDEEPASSDEEPASSDEEPASSDEEPASSDEEPASSDEEPASSDEEPASSDEEPTSSDEEKPTITVTTDKEGDVTVGLEAQFDITVGGMEEWPALPSTTMKADGSDVTITYDFSEYGKVKFGGNYVAIATNLPWDMEAEPELYSAANVSIKSIKFDGVEYGDLSKLAINNESAGGTALRITLMNEWNDNFAKGNAPLSGIELPEFAKFEVTYAVTAASEPIAPESSEEETPSDDTSVDDNTSEDKTPGDCTGKPGDTESSVDDDSNKGDDDNNVPTGVAVAVIPAAMATAGLAIAFVIKKRK